MLYKLPHRTYLQMKQFLTNVSNASILGLAYSRFLFTWRTTMTEMVNCCWDHKKSCLIVLNCRPLRSRPSSWLFLSEFGMVLKELNLEGDEHPDILEVSLWHPTAMSLLTAPICRILAAGVSANISLHNLDGRFEYYGLSHDSLSHSHNQNISYCFNAIAVCTPQCLHIWRHKHHKIEQHTTVCTPLQILLYTYTRL